MTHIPPPPEPGDSIDGELVAYLDRELTPDEVAQVERRLAEDPEYRHRLQQLERAWEMLDELPLSDVDESFTESTLSMVALKVADDAAQAQQAARRRHRWYRLAAVGCVLSALAVGYGITAYWLARPDDRLARDLPVIENMDMYRNVESVEFLQLLKDEGLFQQEVEDEI